MKGLEMDYATNMQTGTCDCPDYLFRGGSYDLGDAGRVCKHFLQGLAERVPCPQCGGRLVFDEKQKVIPVFICMDGCQFSEDNSPIDARIILKIWREQRQLKKEENNNGKSTGS